MPNSHLLYIYNELSQSKSPDPSKLTPGSLLISPTYTNNRGWTFGYFETLSRSQLDESDMLDRHCFWSVVHQKYVDEFCREIEGPHGPCGEFSLQSIWAIDREISLALGIPPATPE